MSLSQPAGDEGSVHEGAAVEEPRDAATFDTVAPTDSSTTADAFAVAGGAARPAPRGAGLAALVESLLFVAPSPTPIGRLCQIIGVDEALIENALVELAAACTSGNRGVRLLRKADRVHLTTAPESAPYIERFLGLDLSSRLSTAALETLAVIAYRQPLTRGDIEAIRGVNCDAVIRTLIARELVEAVGRLEQPGRPFVYGTTLQFLHYFGLESLDKLPPLPAAPA